MLNSFAHDDGEMVDFKAKNLYNALCVKYCSLFVQLLCFILFLKL
ncbi:hypothetical protein B4144_2181 [Bacillus atrophaeus]|nr:hypothetical protein B4144_2181 [Bacillus atrophaeus]